MTPIASTASGLFSQLAPLLAYRAVLITVSKLEEGDLLQVNICPRQLREGENQALTTPLCLTGTAAELDTELASQISTFVASHAGLNSNLAQIQKEIEEAEKAAREEARKKRAIGNGGKKTPETSAPAKSSLEKPEPETVPQTRSLFDAVTPAAPANAPDTAPAQISNSPD
jgi:PRTRC genetic system protein E